MAGNKARTLLEQEEVFCDEFHLVDLRVYDNCKKVVRGCEHVFNLAADMGGAWWFLKLKTLLWSGSWARDGAEQATCVQAWASSSPTTP